MAFITWANNKEKTCENLNFKIQEASRSLSGPIDVPIDDGMNTSELMFKKNQCGCISFYLELWSFRVERDLAMRCKQWIAHKGMWSDYYPGKQGRAGAPLPTCNQSQASPEHSSSSLAYWSLLPVLLNPSVHTPGSEDWRGASQSGAQAFSDQQS